MPQLFLDSANLDDIRACLPFIDGVTINQSLLAKEPKRGYFDAVCEIQRELPEGIHLSAPHVVGVQLPSEVARKVAVSWYGLQTISALKKSGVPVNATCIYTHYQAIMAARAGADYLSVFVGRINDKVGNSADAESGAWGGGYAVISEAKYLGKKIIAGSIRTPLMARMAWDAGADIVTTSRAVIEQMANDEDSSKTAAKFEEDYQKWIS